MNRVKNNDDGGVGETSEVADTSEVYEEWTSSFAVLMRGAEADVLQALARSYSVESASSIAHRCGRSRNQVHELLRFYEANDVVRPVISGARRWYILNHRSPLYSYIRALGAMKLKRQLVTLDRDSYSTYHEH